MRGVARDDLALLLLVKVSHVVDRHLGQVTAFARLGVEEIHDLGEALERGEGQDDCADFAGALAAVVGAGEGLLVDVVGRFLVEPDVVHGLGLPASVALVVGLELDCGGAAA